MEFHEKLQELRKHRGLTQEELAEALFVSRTAISKWESGRGYPSIDSLKEISGYFDVSIDDLLSGDQLILIAEKENESNLHHNHILDIISFFDDCWNCENTDELFQIRKRKKDAHSIICRNQYYRGFVFGHGERTICDNRYIPAAARQRLPAL